MQNFEQDIPKSAPPDEANPNGRPPFTPSDEQKALVSDLASYGLPQKQIARFLGISPMTLRKAFRAELDLAAVEVNSSVLHSLVHMATVRHNASAAIFWAKTRCNFRSAPPRKPKGYKTPEQRAEARKKARAEAEARAKAEQEARYQSLQRLTVYCNDGEPNDNL
jgi:DNA invertase Pin-like site-specific DNA recombinase